MVGWANMVISTGRLAPEHCNQPHQRNTSGSEDGEGGVGRGDPNEPVEQLHDWLAKHDVKWQFNLSRAPWWGGQFERMVGLVKQALYKTIGNGNLTWNELQEVILDVETTLNNCPLSYVEDDIQLPLLTPNSLLFGQPHLIPEQDADTIGDIDLRRRARYLKRCKDAMWSRWSSEYLKALRERHNMKHQVREMSVKPGDVLLIKGEDRNRGKWKIGVANRLIEGRDGIV